MQVLIDGQELGVPPNATYSEAVDAARRHAAGRGRMVVGVSVDGRTLSADEVDVVAEPGLGAGRLAFATEAPGALVRAALSEAAEVLRLTDEARRGAVKNLRAACLAGALSDIAGVTAQWEAVRRTLEQAGELLGMPAASLLGGAGMAGTCPLAGLAACLTEIARCVRDADWSGLADALEYDLSELSAVWVERLVETVGRISDEDAEVPRLVA